MQYASGFSAELVSRVNLGESGNKVREILKHYEWREMKVVATFMCARVCVCAVSYTHLDVYKRQPLHRCIVAWECGSHPFG